MCSSSNYGGLTGTIQLAAFQQVWEAHGPDLVKAAKDRSLGAPGHSQIRDLEWRVHLKVLLLVQRTVQLQLLPIGSPPALPVSRILDSKRFCRFTGCR